MILSRPRDLWLGAPGPQEYSWGAFTGRSSRGRIPDSYNESMFRAIDVVGHGRLGAALATRLTTRGLAAGDRTPDLVVLCVPDAAIADVARSRPIGPWVAHMSGATCGRASGSTPIPDFCFRSRCNRPIFFREISPILIFIS